MRATPNEFEAQVLAFNRSFAPTDGSAFHMEEDRLLFESTDPRTYLPNEEVIDQLDGLDAVLSLMGPYCSGKNGAKESAVMLSVKAKPWHEVPVIHPVTNDTTRLTEFRDGRVEEDGVDYNFAFEFFKNRRAAQLLREGRIVQFAQPRGDHVYFSLIDNFPTSGVALMDTIPATLFDLNRALGLRGKSAIGAYRSVDTFEGWMDRIAGRGDIFDSSRRPLNLENYTKRMKEAALSLAMALDLRRELDIKFFAAEERPEAGKAVVDIVKRQHSEEMQQRGLRGAYNMVKGLEDAGFKAA